MTIPATKRAQSRGHLFPKKLKFWGNPLFRRAEITYFTGHDEIETIQTGGIHIVQREFNGSRVMFIVEGGRYSLS